MDEPTVLEKKIAEMQKYVPFLEDVIHKLKNNRQEQTENPRKAQLQKMEMLYDLLTTKAQQLKLETLEKCEMVLSRLYSKIEKSDTGSSNNTPDQTTSSDMVIDITCPASPPPQINKKVEPPIVIPTERLSSPTTVRNVSNNKANNIKPAYQNKDFTQRMKNFKDKITSLELPNQKSLEHMNVGTQKKSSTVAANNSNRNDLYSPEDCWSDNEIVKKHENSSHAVERPKGVFERLGDKISNDCYANFKVTVNQNNAKSKMSLTSKAITQNAAPTNNTTKSLDLSNYIKEVQSSGCNDISEIGSRRPKHESPPLNKLQEAKKKLLTIYKSGTKQDNLRSSNPSVESMYSQHKPHLSLDNNKSFQSSLNSMGFEKPVDTSNKTIRTDPRLSRSTGLLTNNISTVHSNQHSQAQFSAQNQNRYGMNPPQRLQSDPRISRTTQLANDTNRTYYNRTWQESHMQANFIDTTFTFNQMQLDFNTYSQNLNTYQDQSMSAPQTPKTSNRNQMDTEENWDSDPDTTDTHRPHINENSVTTNVPNCLDRNMDKNFELSINNNHATHPSMNNTGNTGNVKANNVQTNKPNNPQPYQTSPKVVNQTFIPNAFTNKQTFNNAYNPRFTVNQNRNGSARSSAPQQPRTYGEYKKAQEAARLAAVAKSLPKTLQTPNQNQVQPQSETTKNPLPTHNTPASTSTNTASPSTLDKLYRSTNLANSSLPSTRINFKIPKKDITNKTDVTENSDKNSTENSITKTSHNSEHTKNNDITSSNNIITHVVESKNESKSIDNVTTTKSVVANTESKNNDKKSSTINKPNNNKDELTSESSNSTQSISDNTKNLSGNINESTNTNDTIELQNLLENTKNKSLPNKIIKRRLTMCGMRTTPIILESELLPTTSLVMEDLQGKHNDKLDDKIIKKQKRENDMYKITDDNCTVSIQNIIYGKRSTRAQVNFSEGQQTKTLLKQNDSPENSKNKKATTKKALTNTDATPKETKKKQSKPVQKSSSNKKLPGKELNTVESAENEEASTSNSSSIQTNTDLENRVSAAVTDMHKYFPQCSGEELKNLFRSFLEKEMNTQKQTEDVTLKDEKPAKNLTNVSNEVDEKKQTENNPLKGKKRKKNELDRLNEDLNEMFIRDGVLTATGKRMCTHVATESAKKDERIPNVKTKTVEKQLSINQTETPPLNTKVDLHVDINNVSEPPISINLDDPKFHKKCIVNIVKIKTPINKPCPKSKKRVWLLDHVKNTWSKKKIKKEEKNNNIYWHSQSIYTSWCFVCQKDIKFAAVHYKQEHNEFYLSRLPPSVLDRIKNDKSNKPLFGLKEKKLWFHRCPFCLQYLRNTISSWVDHFSTHTGEYSYQCNSCGKVANKKMQLSNKCRTNHCTGTPIAINLFLRTTIPIKGHVCHICNFVQMNRKNLDTHYIEQHDHKTEDVQNSGYSVDLLNIGNVKFVTETQGLKIEKKLESTKSRGLMESDDEEYFDNKKTQKTTKVNKNIKTPKNDKTEQNVSNMSVDCTRIDDNYSAPENEATDDKIVQDQLLIWAAELQAAEREKEASAANDSQKTSESVAVHSNMGSTIIENVSNISNSNAFLLTNDTNDVAANDFYSFAESMKSFETETHVHFEKAKGSPLISITDRLSQRLKDFSQKSNLNTDIFPSPSDSLAEKQFVVSRAIVKLDMSGEPDGTNVTKEPVLTDGTEKQNIEDDEDWEDVEIIDPGPKKDKLKNKRIYQKCTLIRKVNGKPSLVSKNKTTNQNNLTLATENSSSDIDITNLVDLLPSSPIDIAPQLLSTVSSEPLHDLTGITSTLDTNLLSSNIDTTIENSNREINYHEENLNIQETTSTEPLLNPVQEVTENRIVSKKIENIAFAPAKEGYRFYCRIKGCNFIFSSDSSGLQAHFGSDHKLVKWTGFCNTCNFNVNKTRQDSLSIFDELNHLMRIHLVAKPVVINLMNSLTNTVTNIQQSDLNQTVPVANKIKSIANTEMSTTQQSDNINLPDISTYLTTTNSENTNNDITDSNECAIEITKEVNKQPEEQCRPRINVRRLTGDNLSTRKESDTNGGTSLMNDSDITLADLLSRPPIIIQNPTLHNASPQQNSNESLFENMNEEVTIVPIESNPAEGTSIVTPKAIVSDKTNTSNKNATSAQTHFLKITNVCSLNPNPDANTSSKNLLPKPQRAQNKESNIMKQVETAVSDEPQIIAETLPVSQATTGEFVITQTISTEYSTEGVPNGQLGFNISIAPTNSAPLVSIPDLNIKKKLYEVFKCAGTACTFHTRFASTMKDHLHFHALQNFTKNRDYMKCPYCKFEAQDIDGYIEHTQSTHMPPNQNSLTKEIRNILNSMGDSNKTSYTASLPTNNNAKKNYAEELEETVKQILNKTGVSDDKLYRCIVPNCQATLTENTFNKHTIFHTSTLGSQPNQKLKCPHCSTVYRGLSLMKSHIQNHGTHKYFCYICMQTSLNLNKLHKHMLEQHFQKVATVEPLLTKNEDIKAFVGHSEKLTPNEIKEFGNKLVLELKRQKAKDKTIFRQDEIDLLPVDQIFRKEVFCAKCNYRTKVRSNMLRHLQQDKCIQTHNTPAADPVNPVPCLNTSERHFDKMTNLASSSLTSPSPSITKSLAVLYLPKFKYVYEKNIYKCGVHDCEYQTLSEKLFLSHINTLHSTVNTYNCPFCKEEICKRPISVNRIYEHLQFHQRTLYQCTECDFVHFNKSFVEKHWTGAHPGACTSVIEHERNENQTKTTKIPVGSQNKRMLSPGKPVKLNTNNASNKNDNEKQKAKFKWLCKICNFSCAVYQQMSSHTLSCHSSRHAFQCIYCAYCAPNKHQIESHIKSTHIGSPIEHLQVFQKVKITEEIASPQPLWQRNDPKRVRHIRGILMEDEEESTQNQKKTQLSPNTVSHPPVGVTPKPVQTPKKKCNEPTPPAFAKISQHLYLEKYTFACKYCDFISNFDGVKNHWQNVHYTYSGDFPKIHGRFLWTLVNYLKCPLCIDIYGTYNTLEQHFHISHPEHPELIAADPHVSYLKCGFCMAIFTTTNALQKHTTEHHQINGLREIGGKNLRLILKLGKNVNYFKCQDCGDIFHERNQVLNHINVYHKEILDSFNEHIVDLGSINIFCCSHCKYYSVKEEETLKHMIDHYPDFKKCIYCLEEQTSFVSYMQHCYSQHREQSRAINELYTYQKIKNFLIQMLILFPNGLQLTKKSLLSCSNGCCSDIKKVHEYMLHVTMEPPIPRLSIANLVALKSIEVKQSRGGVSALSSKVTTLADLQKLKKISKRRNTVAIDSNFNAEYKSYAKKRKMSGTLPEVPTPIFEKPIPEKPYSYYGTKPKYESLNDVYTVLNISNESTKVSMKHLQNMSDFNPNVVVMKLSDSDIAKMNAETTTSEEVIVLSDDDNDDKISTSYARVKKACPLSEKHKHK
ncbi:uncharacterized protein LOC119670110 isoform X3 [Teleopsis dalmanni]|uniref:uncharacterized protein LOC119670110 isoform X3 n=2 Tax=Teleopsis dalmanni TaxID=139649 RepID=UPI0018CE6CB4|nr:uncharacterized protein LOC119670110 isoform X3 [Teleopsis dalmanni]